VAWGDRPQIERTLPTLPYFDFLGELLAGGRIGASTPHNRASLEADFLMPVFRLD